MKNQLNFYNCVIFYFLYTTRSNAYIREENLANITKISTSKANIKSHDIESSLYSIIIDYGVFFFNFIYLFPFLSIFNYYEFICLFSHLFI